MKLSPVFRSLMPEVLPLGILVPPELHLGIAAIRHSQLNNVPTINAINPHNSLHRFSFM
jgi:hypothetical protein